MDAPVHTETFKDHLIKIFHDQDPESPRDWDNLGTMSCWHRRYRLGDKHHHTSPRDLLIALAGASSKTALDTATLLARAERRAVILPLYLYDHSGIAMNTTGFHCLWDSGQVGFAHTLLEDIRNEFSQRRVTASLRKRVAACLVQEVATYNDYLTGNSFGFVIEKDGVDIDSCRGFFGDYREHCLAAARENVA